MYPKLTYLNIYFNLFVKDQFSLESINILNLHFVGENLFLVMGFLCPGDYLEPKILEFVFLLFGPAWLPIWSPAIWRHMWCGKSSQFIVGRVFLCLSISLSSKYPIKLYVQLTETWFSFNVLIEVAEHFLEPNSRLLSTSLSFMEVLQDTLNYRSFILNHCCFWS